MGFLIIGVTESGDRSMGGSVAKKYAMIRSAFVVSECMFVDGEVLLRRCCDVAC